MGFVIWTYTLLLPNFVAGGVIGWPLFEQGPWGITWLRPQSLFGIEVLSPVMRGAMLALAVNVLVLVAISMLRGVSLRDRMAAMTFLRGAMPVAGSPTGGRRARWRPARGDREDPRRRSRRAGARRLPPGRPSRAAAVEPADRGLLQHMERVLAGAIGASSARLMFTHAMAGRGSLEGRVAELLDETSQELRFSRQLLQATMENVSQGIAWPTSEACIVAWNRRYLEMFAYPEGLVCVGRPVAELIRWNASRGEFGDSDTERQIAKRIAHMKSGKAYVTQRLRRNGGVYEIRGQPMPDGGYVTTYNDITEFKRTELALLEAKQTSSSGWRSEPANSRCARRAGGREAAGRGSERHQEPLRRRCEPRPAAAVERRAALRLDAGRALGRSRRTEIAERIDSSMRAAEEVLDDMLDIARLESGTMRTDIADFPIAETFEHLERQFAPLAARRGLRLRFTRPAVPGAQRSRAAAPHPAETSSRMRCATRSEVACWSAAAGAARCAEIQVWDTGPGIPQQHQRAIFDEFRRLDRPSPWGEHGLGLGLSICHRIALLLGHELGLRSQVGRGSLQRQRADRRRSRSAPAAARRRQRRRAERAWWDSPCSASTTNPRSSRA